MATHLSDSIIRIYGGSYYVRSGVSYYRHNYSDPTEVVKYIEFPINRKHFEVPLAVMKRIANRYSEGPMIDIHTIRMPLLCKGLGSSYKTPEKALSCLFNNSSTEGLIPFILEKKEASPITYYCTTGMLLDAEMQPVVICTWEIEKNESDQWKFIKPILRLDRDWYTMCGDAVRNFMCKKFTVSALSTQAEIPSYAFYWGTEYNESYKDISVLIENIPFRVHTVPIPSINTTQQDLRDLALAHINEIIQ